MFVYKDYPFSFSAMIFFEHCIRCAATFHGCATRCGRRDCRRTGRCWVEIDYKTGEGNCGGRITQPVIWRAAEYATMALDIFHEETLNDARRRRGVNLPPLDPELERGFELEAAAQRFYRREWAEMEAREKAFLESVAELEREAAEAGEPIDVQMEEEMAIAAMQRDAEEEAARGEG